MSAALPLLSHVSIGTNQLEPALKFYDAVMHSLGAKRILDIPGMAVGYGRQSPDFWVQLPHNRKPAGVASNGMHFCFAAENAEQVHAFHAAAIAHGGTDAGAPGPRPDYSPAYYAGFVYDPEGHKLEAMFWDESKA